MENIEKNKRMIDICAFIGWIVSSVIVLYCLYFQVNAPFVVEIYIVATAGMLGLDSLVKGYFKYKIEGNSNEEKEANKKEED